MENGNSLRNSLTPAEVSAYKAKPEVISDTDYEMSPMSILTPIEQSD